MRRFSKLLVYAPDAPTNPSVSYAARLAAASGASVTLADMVEQIPAEVERRLPREWDVPQLVRDRKKTRLRSSAARLRRAGVRPRLMLLESASAGVLIGEMTDGGYDLLVVDAPREPATRDAHAIIAQLVHDCPSRLLLARARVTRRPRILVAVDASPWRPRDTDLLTAELVETAIEIADLLHGEVNVLHAWQSIAEGSMRWAGVPQESLREHQEEASRDTRSELERILKPFRERIPEAQVHLEAGDPRSVVPAFTARNRIGLLVIGTVARSGLSGRIIGNTAEAVLDDVQCSMLVVRRQGAPSPENEKTVASQSANDAP